MKSGTPNAPSLLAPLVLLAVLVAAPTGAPPVGVIVDTPMAAPAWAMLERRLLAENVPACREFDEKYYDARADRGLPVGSLSTAAQRQRAGSSWCFSIASTGRGILVA